MLQARRLFLVAFKWSLRKLLKQPAAAMQPKKLLRPHQLRMHKLTLNASENMAGG